MSSRGATPGAFLVACALLVTFTGCSTEPRGQGPKDDTLPAPMAVRIRASPRAVTVGTPVFRAGGGAQEGPLAFGRVNGGVIDAQGRLWVADDMASHIVRVDTAGQVDVVGSGGRGPAQFAQLAILGWSEGRVVAYDQELNRVSVISPGVDTFSARRLPPPVWQGRPRQMVGRGSAGQEVFFSMNMLRTGPGYDPKTPRWRDYPPIRVAVEDSVAAVTLFSEMEQGIYFDGKRYLRSPFTTAVRAAVFADTAFLVGTAGADVLVSDLAGHERTALNLGEGAGTPVDDAVADKVRAHLEAMSETRRGAPRMRWPGTRSGGRC